MNSVIKAANIIRAGGLVAFPTETVYGLGADARSQEACQKIFELKKRPNFNPLIVHVSSIKEAKELAMFNQDAEKLSKLWPGPLSIVLPIKQAANIAPVVIAGLPTIAIRIPIHPMAIALIKETNCPIAAPSANISGYISASTEDHVSADFGEQIFIIPDSNKQISCGLESTIIDLSCPIPTILRHGFITVDLIEDILGKKIKVSDSLMQIKAPGMMQKHYSPQTALKLNRRDLNPEELGLNFGSSNFGGNYNLSASGDLAEAAKNLYILLRKLDKIAIKLNIKTIAIAPVPIDGIGIAINDRLKRAAS